MAKDPNERSMKRDDSLFGATLFFFAACLAEAYLMVLRKYYIHGDMVTQTLVWHDRLPVFAGLGAAVLVLGVVLSVLWKADGRRRLIGWCLAGIGAFFAGGSLLIRAYQEPALMLLSVLWAFYDRECSIALTVLSASMIVLWVSRRLFSHLTLGVPVKVLSVVYILLLAGLCWLARGAASGLSAAAIVLALFSASMAYYAMWALGIVFFALAVYYTVQQL